MNRSTCTSEVQLTKQILQNGLQIELQSLQLDEKFEWITALNRKDRRTEVESQDLGVWAN